jgi:hypothetical protein
MVLRDSAGNCHPVVIDLEEFEILESEARDMKC